MRQTDVAIVGGGLAGSLAAAMLGRAGHQVLLIDPHDVYPVDFRCEKLDASQLAILQKTGLAPVVFNAATWDEEVWIVHGGRVAERKPHNQISFLYDTLVNTVRDEIPANVDVIIGKAAAIVTSAEHQTVTLTSGDTLSARLVIMATGLNIGLRHMLGVEREVLSANHSISVGFDMRSAAGSRLPFPALTYYADHPTERMAYMTLFPVQSAIRANLFVYRDMADPLLRTLRSDPRTALLTLMPELEQVTGPFEVEGFVKIRPVDLCRMQNYLHAGVVLVGDAFGTSCPAAGTGVNKVLTDVERLCNVYVPRWLSSPGMSVDKIKEFYDDPDKRETDRASLAKAFFLRSLSTDTAAIWKARRQGRRLRHTAFGLLRQVRRKASWTNGRAVAAQVGAQEPLITVSATQGVSITPASASGSASASTPLSVHANVGEEARS
ncbi:MAG: FAD-dependent oxidoreductase [Variibacter sp.]